MVCFYQREIGSNFLICIRLMSMNLKFCSLYLCLYLYFCVCDCIICLSFCICICIWERLVSKEREGTFLMQVGEIKVYKQWWRPKSSSHNKANINAHTLPHHSWYCSNDSIFLGQKQVFFFCVSSYNQGRKINQE